MSAARPTSSLLTAGAVLALSLAGPGTALADDGKQGGKHGQSGQPGSSGPQHDKKADAPQSSSSRQPSSDRPSSAKQEAPDEPAAKPAKPAKDKPAKDKPAKPARPAAPQPAAATEAKDPAGNNGTIKIDTVPGDPDRANRPHPSSGEEGGCSFVLQFFNFDADQHADITFTGQAPTRSAGALLTLSNQLISTSPADGALEDGHSVTLSAADLGLLGTPTAAKGWHVKVAVDALEAPGGAKQKVFWLDCASGAAAVSDEAEDADEATAEGAGEAEVAPDVTTVAGAERDSGVSASGEGVAVLSESASREASAASTEQTQVSAAGTSAASAQAGRSATSTLASVLPFAAPAALPFTGPAGLAAMVAAGVTALVAGVAAQRAGRRRTAAAQSDAQV